MKLYFGASAIITAVIISLVSFIYYSEYQQFSSILVKEASLSLESESELIRRELRQLSKDLLYISNNKLFNPQQSSKKKITQSLVQFMKLKKEYDQIRYLDVHGMEIIRVNQGIPPIVVSEADLQSKINRDYVRDGLKLQKNEILLSSIDLNIENNEIEKPYKPTLRLVIPSINSEGKVQGLFVSNFLASELLEKLKDIQSEHLIHIHDAVNPQVELIMANAQGNWIIAPKGKENFAFALKSNINNELLEYSKEISKLLQKQDKGVVLSGDTQFVFKNIYPISEVQVGKEDNRSSILEYKIKKNDIYWTMIVEIRNSVVHTLTQTYFYKSLPYILLFWIVLQIVTMFLISTYRQSRVQHSELLLTASALENSADGVIITNSESVILRVNESYCRISGYDKDELIGKKTNAMSSGWTDVDVYQDMWNSINRDAYWEGELKDRSKDGSLYVVLLKIIKINDPDTNEIVYVGIITDITEKKESEAKIMNLAYRDSLTNLPNRNLLYDRLRKAINQRLKKGEKVAIMYMDLDNFKFVNDSAGHLIGDKFLIEIANRFREVVREQDTLARVGGDEFIVLLETVNESFVSDVAQRLIESLQSVIVIDTYEFSASVSIGISLYPTDSDDAQTLIKHADIAMYEVKNSGKNNYKFFLSSMNDELLRRVKIETNLLKALENEEFTIYYQPQVDARSKKVVGAEALLRWTNAELGFISPVEFIPICESTGKIVAITEWILEQVCRDIKQIEAFYKESFRIAVNISSLHLKSPDFVPSIDKIVKNAFIEPYQLDLEITEGALVDNIEDTVEKLKQLRSLGYKVSLDDFGTGYSSLSYLKKFPFDKLKIDQSFVRGLPHDVQDIGIVRSIIAITKALGLDVIAEGVETDENLKFLIHEDCRLIQGYFFSKPLPFEQYLTFLKTFNER